MFSASVADSVINHLILDVLCVSVVKTSDRFSEMSVFCRYIVKKLPIYHRQQNSQLNNKSFIIKLL